ncbi:F420-dependent NADP oxidoreductase [Komarekiella sp. 'clone 1']|uniref:F420-dependent NADP oxidoreductase n=1 Tax=Komarekiella delphini-convector SJRDD-AB1 TaxID=2593771 RepID=A0AA40T5D1_9NOST|nr:NAD(P)-binding domain-containing protein [Komarekiella delphini-convector]MBD6620887.1 F420-dependent NADP oxidoreductase [Komarekiella delphini-convector SJRDD-AB1]
MKIGIIGSGNMGRSVGILWAERGHEVFFSSREAAKAQAIAELAGHGARGGTNDAAAAFADVIFYGVRELPSKVFSATDVLASKVLIDCNNSPIPEDFAFEPIAESIAEKFAADVPNAHIVKAFNTFAQEVFELSPDPLGQYQVSCFVCSDNEQAKQTVINLIAEIGFNPVDCGELRRARMVEGLGDFIRFMIGGRKLGSYATISVHQLPQAKEQRLGGRKPGYA